MFAITCKSIILQKRPFGSDIAYITFFGPSSFSYCPDEDPELVLHIERGKGEDYIRSTFGVEPDDIYECK